MKKEIKDKFKLGDIVRCVSKESYDKHCKNKIGKILSTRAVSFLPYTVEFFEHVNGHDGHSGGGKGKGKEGYCWSFLTKEIELYKKPILKIFLKEKEKK